MRVLIISFYYEPDLCAGSFRTTFFVEALKGYLRRGDTIEVITTWPNRYSSFKTETKELEPDSNVAIKRIKIPLHKSAFFDQAKSFLVYFIKTLKYVRGREYDVVFATSSRLFSAFLGAVISKSKNIPLYLDVRDIFVDTMRSVLKNSSLRCIIPLFSLAEKFTMNRACKINLTSRGFEPYFRKRYQKDYSFFPNGIDDDFLNFDLDSSGTISNNRVVFTYAGNLGEGQGLEKIVPKIAQKYKNIEFYVIGDGGRKNILRERTRNLQNVKLLRPVNRKKLIKFYEQSDILFLHLNNYEAFKKVLPSKIFEYAATYKPVIAGVDGYAKKFLEEHLPGSLIFKPGDFDDFCHKYDRFGREIDANRRKEFITKFSRKKIMSEMVKDFLNIVPGGAR